MKRAALYVRVSYSEQVHGYSLDVQERACRDLCEREGWKVAGVYREEGESAKTTDRPELQRMLVDVTRRKAGVDFVVIYDLSRLARNTFDHLAIQRSLQEHGVALRAATQNLEDSDEGKFVATVLSATNELENALRRRKTVGGMKEALERGRWPWVAPLGYVNRRSEDGREKWVEPNPEIAPHLRWAFGRAASGLYSKDEIRRDLAARGLEVPRETLYRTLRNPFYAGRVCSPKWGINVAGQHEALVDLETFRAAARAVRARRGYVTGPTVEFPFRQLVRCDGCGRGLAGYHATGKRKTRHPYYRCQPCRVNVRPADLEARFAALLDRLAPSPRLFDALELVVRDTVGARRASQKARSEAAARRLAGERQKRERLFELFAYRDAIAEDEYHRRRGELDERIATLEHEASAAASPPADFEPALRRARKLLELPLVTWDQLPGERRPAFLRGMFPAGLRWDPAGDFRTPEKSLLRLPIPAVSRPGIPGGSPPEADFEAVEAWMAATLSLSRELEGTVAP